MFPIAKTSLPFHEISEYWSREIYPPASSNELLHCLEGAWWRDEFRAESGLSRLQFLKKIFASMRNRDDVGIVFVVGDDEGPLPVEYADGSMGVDARQRIPVPCGNPESWDEASCEDAFHALAKAFSIDDYPPDLAVFFGWIELSYEEFTAWLSKRGYAKPTFWQPGLKTPTHKKDWKPKAGDKNKLTDHERAVVSVIKELWPDGL